MTNPVVGFELPEGAIDCLSTRRIGKVVLYVCDLKGFAAQRGGRPILYKEPDENRT